MIDEDIIEYAGRRTRENYVIVPALPILNDELDIYREGSHEYNLREEIKANAKRSIECYGVTEAGLEYIALIDCSNNSIIHFIEFVNIARIR